MASPQILVVDDDAGAVETLADILEANRYRVATAYSGDVAISMTRQTRYDAILMDIRMPGIDGVEALRTIRAAAPEIPVIMMTAFTRHELVQEAERARATAVLGKPLEMGEVLALLEDATRRGRGPE